MNPSNMRVVVTGAGGMLAQAVLAACRERAHEAIGLRRVDLDVRDGDAVRQTLTDLAPDAVVQCAAFTAVDEAEEKQEEAFALNAEATEVVAGVCARLGATLVYPSTDYVFSGEGDRPYRPDDSPGPLNVYGRSKLAGEKAALATGRSLVVRTSWLYGDGGRHFVGTMQRLARERDRVEVVNDQVGRPTWTGVLAPALLDLVERNARGVHHVTGGGEPTTWHGFAAEIFGAMGVREKLHPTVSAALSQTARRPAYSVLDCSLTERLLERRLPDWRTTLREYLAARSETELRSRLV